MVSGDQIPIVDVNATTSPTGETKYMTLGDFGAYVAQTGLIAPPFQSWQYANGLAFDDTAPNVGAGLSSSFGKFPDVGSSSFSLVLRVMVPSTYTGAHTQSLFGIGSNAVWTAYGSYNTAYIGIAGSTLVGYVADSVNNSILYIPNFFNTYYDRTVHIIMSKPAAGTASFFVNGAIVPSGSVGATPTGSLGTNRVFMNTGVPTTGPVKCTIYEAQVYNRTFDTTSSAQLFFGGSSANDPTLISSYIPTSLQPGNTQWLDAKGNNNILLPISGALATNPAKRFSLRYYLPASGFALNSAYLGYGGSNMRDVLPPNYVLTSCVLSTPGKPLISLGTSDAEAPISASGTDSWRNNRVPYTSASYGVNNLELLHSGFAHVSRSIWVQFASSSIYSGSIPSPMAECTFSFEGFIRD